jgi:hypothetical protein
MAAGPPDLASSRLRRLALRAAEAPPPTPEERCELCGEPIPPEHRHLIDLETRELMCSCRACSLLFDREAAGGGHYRLVPERRLRLDGFRLPDPVWERLRIPVDMAFFFRSSADGRVMAFYPSPMGPTESQLGLEAWDAIQEANPVLETLEPDVEALLVNRARGARRQWLVPLDECYRLVGVIRSRWRGLSGGKEVWQALEDFFENLDRRCKPASAHPNGEGGTRAATASAAEGSRSGT